MMNKKDYIRQVDEIQPSDKLRNSIANLNTEENKTNKKSKHKTAKILTAVAACFVCAIIAVSAISPALKSVANSSIDGVYGYESYEDKNSGSYQLNTSDESSDAIEGTGANSSASTSFTSTSSRKIIKSGEIYISVNSADDFSQKLNDLLNKDYAGSYISDLHESTYSDSKNVRLTVNVNSEQADEFIEKLATLGKITDKDISTNDITDSYYKTASTIKALETEEKTLLKLLESCQSVEEIITVQDRLADIRSQLISEKDTLKAYDEKVQYSSFEINVSQTQKVVEAGNDSVWKQISIGFKNSLYNVGQFFENFFIGFVSSVPYLVIIAIIAVIVILIIKAVQKKKRK